MTFPEFDTWGFNLSLNERLDYWFSVRLTEHDLPLLSRYADDLTMDLLTSSVHPQAEC